MESDTDIGNNVAECLQEQKGSENDVEASNVSTPLTSSSKDDKERDVEGISCKVARLSLENGAWSCTHALCSDADSDNMIICWKCKSKRHFGCTKLPLYQLSLFLSKSYKKKFVCES